MKYGQGVTSFNQAIGASQVVTIGGEAGVLETLFLGVTGGTVNMSGLSTAIGGSVIAAGMELLNGTFPLSVDRATVYLAADGGATVQILQKLSEGYAGKAKLNGQ